MNPPLLIELVYLRYRLQWANVRIRNGRIILFLAGGIVLGTFAALALFAGLEGGVAAVRAGRAEAVARDAFSIIFLQAMLISNLMGLGMAAIFSETELRRYPLTDLDRLVARHVIAILDPFWLLYLFLYLGLSLGLFVTGNGSAAAMAGVALLLFLCNYVAARVVGLATHHLATAGARFLAAGALVAAVAIVWAARAHGPFYPWLEFTPPFAAANAITQGGFSGPLTILAWLGVLLPLLAWLEQRPTRQRRVSGAVAWDRFFDRAGRRFGPSLGPLVAFWLRFTCRNIITRRLMWLALPVSSYIAYVFSQAEHAHDPNGLFVCSLGALPLAVLMAPGRIAVNRFGLLGGGFRRLLLLPIQPSALLRSATYACTLLSLAMLPVALTFWVIVAPHRFDWRMIVMLACSALTGISFLHAAAAWASVYDPSRGNYFLRLGNDLSFGANVVFMAVPVGAMAVPIVVGKVWPSTTSPASWWMLLPFPVIGAAVYFATLAALGTGFTRRRERILAVVEQKD